MTARNYAAAALVGGLVLLTGACSGGSDTPDLAPIDSSPIAVEDVAPAEDATEVDTVEVAEEEPAEAPAQAPGELTAPGTRLAVGDTGLVEWVGSDSEVFSLAVTIDGVRQGTLADLDAILSEDNKGKVQGYTPYYVDFTFVKGDLAQPSMAFQDASNRVDAVNADGSEIPQLTVFGDFELCDSGYFEESVDEGAPQKSCSIFLAPGGQEFGAVRWAQFDTDYDMYDGNPVFWDK